MLLVKSDMIVLGDKKISSRVRQIKVILDGLVYKRLEFTNQDGSLCTIQWLRDGIYLDEKMESIMEKIYQEKESN